MEIEKIFKNLILADFIVIILMVISSMYQPSEISNLYENLNDGLLSNFEYFSRIVSISLFFLYLFTLSIYFLRQTTIFIFSSSWHSSKLF